MTKKTRLGDIATVITKGTTPTTIGFSFVDKGINFIKIESIGEDGVFLTDKFAHITDECDNKLKRSRIEENDILFSIAGAIGRTAIVPRSILPANTNQALAIIRIPQNMINLRFVLYALQSQAVKEQSEKQKQGVAQLNLSLKNIADIQIPIVSSIEQDEIVKTLATVDTVIALRKEQIRLIDQLVKSRFIELFGDPVLNSYGWDVVTIGDIVTDVKYGTSKPAVEGGKYPYLRMNNLTYDGHLDLSDMKYIDIPDNEIEKCIVRKGDVLFNRTNSIELVGKTCVFDLDYDMVIAGYIIRVRLNDKLLPIVLSNYMNSTVLKEQLRNMAKGAVNQANINAQELQSIKIYLPPIELQNQFATFVAQTDKSKMEVQRSLEKLKLLKNSLMQKFFG